MCWAILLLSLGLNVLFILYVIVGVEWDEEFWLFVECNFNVGGDVKIVIIFFLNFDLIFNFDFSQVEVDQQLINLSCFEFFFLEWWQFFFENEDLFGKFGFFSSCFFFSCRIGLVQGMFWCIIIGGDEIEVQCSFNVLILVGVWFSGKLDNNWWVGLLNMQIGFVFDVDLVFVNYFVGVLQ